MSDVFISYASADREAARKVAEALVRGGWTVWWDRTIPIGQTWDDVIEGQLDSAACVVVLWSRASTSSSWVKSESAEAMRRGVLVPALIEETKIPLEFRRLQAADLLRWQNEIPEQELQKLNESVASHVGRDPNNRSHDRSPSTSPQDTAASVSADSTPLAGGSPRQGAQTTLKEGRSFNSLWVVAIVLILGLGGFLIYARQASERLKKIAVSNAHERERLSATKGARERERLAVTKEAQERESLAAVKAAQLILVSPPNNSSFDNYPRDITLSWRSAPQAATYTVEIDCYDCCEAGKWCTDLGKNWNSVPSLRATNYHFQWVGAQRGRWRVSAVDSANRSLFTSEWWQFEFTK